MNESFTGSHLVVRGVVHNPCGYESCERFYFDPKNSEISALLVLFVGAADNGGGAGRRRASAGEWWEDALGGWRAGDSWRVRFALSSGVDAAQGRRFGDDAWARRAGARSRGVGLVEEP